MQAVLLPYSEYTILMFLIYTQSFEGKANQTIICYVL